MRTRIMTVARSSFRTTTARESSCRRRTGTCSIREPTVRSRSGISKATDGQKLTLGNTTLTLYITPGHTPGTISTVFPVKDNGTPHLAALWGGVGLNTDRESVQKYIRSAQRFSGIVRQVGADIILANHTDWDRSKINLPILSQAALTKRAPGSPNPYIVGNAKVLDFLKVAEECATARVNEAH